MQTIAIVGTGVAGLGCAWNLRERARLTFFEQDHRPGGHTNTVEVQENGKSIPIDTGFIVFNKVTYPNLTRLFTELDIAIKPSEMSFSVQHLATGIEYNGMGLNRIFAQRRNIFRPRFHHLLRKIGKFFEVAKTCLADPACESMTLRQFVDVNNLGRDFFEFYLIPMCSAVWSTDPRKILDFPAWSLLHFFDNHGFLGVNSHHQWFTVDGGAKQYVQKMLAGCGAPRLKAKVVEVSESPQGAHVRLENGEVQTFDRVVLATHADQALRVLKNPTEDQHRLLSPFDYQYNHAVLHTDASVMPKRRRAWASWNYRVEKEESATTHYWMNALQGISKKQNYFVSLNAKSLVRPECLLYEKDYEHPVFTLGALRAQKELPSLNKTSPDQKLFFCGSYFRHGFHEDAYTSGLDCSVAIREALSLVNA
ncbi:MAG: FAD-dependent oxidoreductase [Chthoniobacterales bacterium]